jgi:potassium efflux system protein
VIHRFFKSLFLFCAFVSVLLSADINDTIVDGNATVYQSLLQQISKENNQSEDTVLAKTLLEQLVKSDNFALFKAKKIDMPKDSEGYRKLFLNYMDDIEQISTFQTKYQQTNDKIEISEDQIKMMDVKDSRLLVYQLQDAFYRKKAKAYQNAIALTKKEMQKIRQTMINTLERVSFDQSGIKKDIDTAFNKLNEEKKSLEMLQIELEQAELLNDSKKTKVVSEKIERQKSRYRDAAKEYISKKFLLFSSQVKEKNEAAFQTGQQIEKEAEKDGLFDANQIDLYLHLLFADMETKFFGQLKTLTGSSKQELKTVLLQIWEYMNQPLFTLNDTSISIFKLLIALLIFISGFIVGSLYKRKIRNLSLKKRSLTPSTRTILANLGYYLIVTIAFFISLNVLGVKLTSFAMVAGALSVGIGFGLQNIVSNFVSGLILMFEKSIKIGDYVQVDDDTKGYVTDIRMRSTIINTNENIDIIIPNQSFIQNNVINWTMNDFVRRFSIRFGVAYGTDVHKVADLVVEAVRNSEYRADIVEDEERKTRVIMTEMADSSVSFELFVWVQGDKLHRPKRTASEFLMLIYDTLYANNIEIPFPQQDIHIRSVEAEIPVQLKKEA